MIKKLIILFLLATTLQSQTYEQLSKAEQKYEKNNLSVYFLDASKKTNIPVELIKEIANIESHCKNAKGKGNCNGIMQVKGGSLNPQTNIIQGAMIFRHYLIKCKYDTLKALTAYNRGYAGMKRYYRRHKHTSKYASRVIANYHITLTQNSRQPINLKIDFANINLLWLKTN